MLLKRVVVTGIGTINPIGNNVAEYFKNLDNGVSGAGLIDSFDVSHFKTRFACTVKNFDFMSHGFDRKMERKCDRFTQFALVATKEAMADSKLDLDAEDKTRIGVIVGSGVGGLNTFTEEMMGYVEGETPRFNPFMIPKFITSITSGQISLEYGLRGPNFCVVSACATSSHAISTALDLIRLGRADVMISGGAEAPIAAPGIGGFNQMHALSTNNEEYMTASRPFDKTRDGFVIGEGAGILILEEYEHAVARGAHIYAELIGSGLSADAYHLTAPSPDGEGAASAICAALKDAGIKPEEVDYVNTHGTSTHHGDIAELLAIKRVFGEHAYKLSIDSTKSMTGHLLGASGAIEAIACIHAIQDSIIPPTINFKEKDEDIDYNLDLTLLKARKREVKVAISNNFGFGGQNACLVLRTA